MRFIDTNVFIYAASDQDLRKQDIALELIHHAISVNHDAAISMQVVSEFTNTMVGKLKASPQLVAEWYSYMNPLLVSEVTREMLRNAMDIQAEYHIQYYDAVIIAAAGGHEIEFLNSGCRKGSIILCVGRIVFLHAVQPLVDQCRNAFLLLIPTHSLQADALMEMGKGQDTTRLMDSCNSFLWRQVYIQSQIVKG